MDLKKIEEGTVRLLEGLIGPEWVNDSNYEDTPARVAKFYSEMFGNHEYKITMFKDKFEQMITIAHHTAWTLCPHHLLPVKFDISLSYIPNGMVMGLSKMVRLVMNHFSEPILQETLTDSIADELMRRPRPKPLGAAVLIYGDHACMQIRGTRTTAHASTSAMRGVFLDKSEVRQEFLDLVMRR